MSNSSESNVLIAFEGRTMSLETALKTTREGLAGTGAEANATGDKLAKMSEGEAKAGKEARNMGEAVKVAADTVGLLGIESGESYIRLQSLRHGVTDFTASMGGLKAGLIGGIGLGAAFAGASFLKEAVVDSIAGEQATNQLQAALRKTPGAFQETNRAIEESSRTWAKFGVSIGTLKAAVAQGVGAGIKPETIIGQPGKIADLAKALGEDVPTALGEIERGGRGAQRVISRLNLSLMDQRRTMQELANPHMSANDRTQFLLNRVQQTAFAGQGAAGTKGAQGQIAALNASLADLKETVGTSLLPVLTDMVSTFTGMIQGANSMLSAVGGLSTFLQATWKPALIGIATIFLGLKISHSALGDFIRSRLLGDLSSSAGGFAEEAVEATKASDAIGSIPPVVRTLASFDAKAASIVKDAYLLNLSHIPGALIKGADGALLAATPQPLTTAAFDGTAATAEVNAYESSIKPVQVPVTFDTAGALIEPQATPIRIPVEYDTAQAFSEAQATPLKIPVEYDTAQAFNEAQAVPLNVPVTYNTANAFSEAATHPLSIPVTYDTTQAFSEAAATPLAIPVSYDTTKAFSEAQTHALSIPVTYDTTKAFSEANARPINVPVTYDAAKAYSTTPVHPLDVPVTYDYKNAFREAYAHPLDIPVTYNTTHAFSEANARPIRIPVTYDTSHTLSEATSHPIKIPVEYDPTNALHESSAHPIKIPVEYESPKPFAAGAPIAVKVRPEWVSNAASGLKAGLAAGIGITIADALFTGAIFQYKGGKTTDPFGGSAATTKGFPTEIKTVPTGTQKVYVTNPGAIGDALGFGAGAPKGGRGDTWVSVKGQPTIKVAPGQKMDVGNWSSMPNIGATTPTGSTVKIPSPITVHAKQDGTWTTGLTMDSVLRMGQMIGEIAVGSMIGNALGGLVGKIPFGTMLAKLKDLFPKGGGPGDDFTSGNAIKGVEALLADARAGAAPVTPSSSPIHYTGKEHVTSLQDVFNTGLKAVSLATPLGLLIGGAFAAKGLVPVVSTALENIVTLAFKSIKMPALHLDTTVKLPALHFDMGGMLGDINKQLVSWGPALGTLIIGGLILGLTRGRVEIPALAKLAGAHAAAPDPFNTTYDPKTHKFRQMTQKEQDARTVKDNAGEAAMFKGLGQWFATNIIGGIKFDAGKIHDAGAATITTFSDAIKGGWSALTQRISALFNDLINAVLKPINDMLSHIPGTHPIPLAGAHTSSSSPHGGSKGTGFNLASINPAVLHPPAHVMAHHAPVVHHHTTHHTAHQTTTVNVGGIHISEAKTPQATGDAVLKALSAAAQRKTRHGR